MAAMLAKPVPSVGPAEMQAMVARAGLTLNPGQMADLVLAWRQLAGLIAAIPRGRPLVDDQAYVFRLPAPAPDYHQPKPEPGRKPARKRARPTR
jgi:hypothetical protein